MKKMTAKARIGIALVGVGVIGGAAVAMASTNGKRAPLASAAPKAMLTVTAVTPQVGAWPQALSANGSIAAWQEASVGSELGGLRLAAVRVDVGDVVRRGQVLATFASDTVAADLAVQVAALEEARSAMSEAQANADRARILSSSGALSAQQATQYLTAERTARARVTLAEAHVRIEEIRLRQTSVLAPDDGVISARSATLGAVAGQGQELFRLIRQGRLEWRAEVIASDLPRLKPGQTVLLDGGADGVPLAGKVRMIAPTIDAASRNAMVYVDLPASRTAHPGMFMTGQFQLGASAAVTVPQEAVATHDGYSYVYRIGQRGAVAQTRVEVGRRQAGRIELVGLPDRAMLVAARGAGFLSDGDVVKVVAPPLPQLASK